MNPRSAQLKTRSNSTPLSSEHMRIRRCDFNQLVDRAVELRMRAKKTAQKRQKSPKDRAPPPPFFLMPRLGIVDDKSQDIIIAQLEVPDVSPESVKLELHGDKLTVSGERRPRLVTVPTEYEASFLHQSQTVIGGDQRPRLIMLGGGRVASFAVPLAQPQRQSQPAQSGAPQPHGNSPASMVFYNELRYGPFRRDLRVPLGTQAGDIVATFNSGMLVLSWSRTPSAITTVDPRMSESAAVAIPVAPDPHAAPIDVKVESMEE